MAFTDLIVEYPNVLSKELCDEIIRRFDEDDRKYPGSTAWGVGGTKTSIDLNISEFDGYEDLDSQMYEAFKDPLQDYVEKYTTIIDGTLGGTGFHDTGYQVQRTDPDGYYHWHHDFTSEPVSGYDHVNDAGARKCVVRDRHFTYIFYLNDRTEFPEDGRTQFTHAGEIYSIIPEVGKLLMFPANVIYTHRGEVLKNGVKYLATGWCCTYGTAGYHGMNPEYEGDMLDFVRSYATLI